jgi:O-antigen chain-terminating methyltransferase
MYEDFYRDFEDKYRGSRELIKKRLEVYLPFVLPLHSIYPQSIAIDIGCGRGEWLELLGDNSIIAKGVDSDSGMVEDAKELDITLGDGIEYLSQQESNSAFVISAFHLVEHLLFEDLMKLVAEANRVLVDGGILILETPNPENIKVASETFYLDPTHIKPIPSELLSFITQYHKFKRDKTLRLQEDKSIHNQLYVNVGHIIEAVSPDYAIVAQKNASEDILSLIDKPFDKEYGLSPLMLVNKFEARMIALESQLQDAHKMIHLQQGFINRSIILIKNHQNSINHNSSNIDHAINLANHANHLANHANNNAIAIQARLNYLVNRIRGNFLWKLLTPKKRLKNLFNKIKASQEKKEVSNKIEVKYVDKNTLYLNSDEKKIYNRLKS